MGIITLYPSNSDDIDLNLSLNLDIIALHGLNGNAERTWTHPTTKSLWLRDFLPLDMPRARVMVFSYNAKAAFENCTAGIIEHARDLLRCLIEKREGVNERIRPLVILGHSLGGLVLKQALLLASQQDRYRDIIKAIRMTIFLGTPHGGSNAADYGAILARVPTALAMKGSPVLLESLRKGNAPLQKLTKDFRKLLRERECLGEEKEIEVVSFYETKPIGLLLVVERDSALLTPKGEKVTYEEQIPVAANHRDICRFGGAEDETYISIVKRIKASRRKMLAIGRKEVKNEHFLVPGHLNPHFTGRNDIRNKMREALVEEDWDTEKKQKRFVLYGMGGSGKTTVTLKFVGDYRDRFWGVFFIDASSITTAESGLLNIAQALKLEPHIDKVKAYLSTQQHWVLIIDNADDPKLDVEKLLPPGNNGTVIMTTRNIYFREYSNVGSCVVDEMCAEDSVALLLKTSGLDSDGVERREAAEEVVKTLGYLALAIIQAGAVIRQGLVNLDGFCDLYSKRKKELLESGRPNVKAEDQRSVYTTWEISIEMIEAMKTEASILALELLRLFSFMHFDGIMERMFESVRENLELFPQSDSGLARTVLMQMMPSGWDQLLMSRAMILLTSFSLITMDDERRISIHPLVHEWSRERMPDGERRQAWCTAAITLPHAADFNLQYEKVHERKLLLPHIDTFLSHRVDGLFEDGLYLEERIMGGMRFSMCYRENFRTREAIELSAKLLECVKKRFQQDDALQLRALKDVSFDFHALGRYSEALVVRQEILNLELLAGDDKKQFSQIVFAMVKIADTYNCLGEDQKSIEVCEDVLTRFQDKLPEDSEPMLQALDCLCYAKHNPKKPKAALRLYEKAYALRNRSLKKKTISDTKVMTQLCDLYRVLKQYKKARALEEEVISIYTEIYGAEHMETTMAKARVQSSFVTVSFRSSRQKREQEIKNAKAIVDACRTSSPEMSVVALEAMEKLSLEYFNGGSLERARVWQEELVDILTQKWGKDYLWTTTATKRLKHIQNTIATRKVFLWWVPKAVFKEDWLRA